MSTRAERIDAISQPLRYRPFPRPIAYVSVWSSLPDDWSWLPEQRCRICGAEGFHIDSEKMLCRRCRYGSKNDPGLDPMIGVETDGQVASRLDTIDLRTRVLRAEMLEEGAIVDSRGLIRFPARFPAHE